VGLVLWWFRAGAHDGVALGALLDAEPRDADHAYIVVSSARSGQDELRSWLRNGAYGSRSRTRLGRLVELENLRLAAAALDDREAEAEIRGMVERRRRACFRRATLAPLAMLEEVAEARRRW
jgi:hypothetical protein